MRCEDTTSHVSAKCHSVQSYMLPRINSWRAGSIFKSQTFMVWSVKERHGTLIRWLISRSENKGRSGREGREGEGRGQRQRAKWGGRGDEREADSLCVCVCVFPSQWNLTVVFSSLELWSMWRKSLGTSAFALFSHAIRPPLLIFPPSSSRPPPPSKFLFICQHAAALQLFPVSPRIHLSSRGQKMEETLSSQRSPFPGQAL